VCVFSFDVDLMLSMDSNVVVVVVLNVIEQASISYELLLFVICPLNQKGSYYVPLSNQISLDRLLLSDEISSKKKRSLICLSTKSHWLF